MTATGWDRVAELRREFAGMADGLSPEQAAAPSLCGHWTVHQVVGHLASFVDVALPRFVLSIARARFDYDRAADRMATALAQRPVDDLAAVLRTKSSKQAAIPLFPAEMTLTDVAVHTQDVRRPLELPGPLEGEVVRTALAFMTGHKMSASVTKPATRAGLRFEASDLDWSAGEGRSCWASGRRCSWPWPAGPSSASCPATASSDS